MTNTNPKGETMKDFKNDGYKLVQILAVTKGFSAEREARAIEIYRQQCKKHDQVSVGLAQLLAHSSIEVA